MRLAADESRPEKFIEIIAKSLGRAISSDEDDVLEISDVERAKTLGERTKARRAVPGTGRAGSNIAVSAGQIPGEVEDVASLKEELCRGEPRR